MSIFDFLKRRPSQPTNGMPEPSFVLAGIIQRGDTLYLCDFDHVERGVKRVSLKPELHKRYLAAWESWMAVQDELRALPKSLRPRRAAVRRRKVEEQAQNG